MHTSMHSCDVLLCYVYMYLHSDRRIFLMIYCAPAGFFFLLMFVNRSKGGSDILRADIYRTCFTHKPEGTELFFFLLEYHAR